MAARPSPALLQQCFLLNPGSRSPRCHGSSVLWGPCPGIPTREACQWLQPAGVLGGDCPSAARARPLRERLQSTFHAPAGRERAGDCESKTRQRAHGPEVAAGMRKGIVCSSAALPLSAGRQPVLGHVPGPAGSTGKTFALFTPQFAEIWLCGAVWAVVLSGAACP